MAFLLIDYRAWSSSRIDFFARNGFFAAMAGLNGFAFNAVATPLDA